MFRSYDVFSTIKIGLKVNFRTSEDQLITHENATNFYNILRIQIGWYRNSKTLYGDCKAGISAKKVIFQLKNHFSASIQCLRIWVWDIECSVTIVWLQRRHLGTRKCGAAQDCLTQLQCNPPTIDCCLGECNTEMMISVVVKKS